MVAEHTSWRDSGDISQHQSDLSTVTGPVHGHSTVTCTLAMTIGMATVIRHDTERYPSDDSTWQLNRKAAAGEILRLRPGSYLVTQDERLDQVSASRIHLAKIIATVSELNSSAIARESAALLHGLPIPNSLIPERVIVHRNGGGHCSPWIKSYKIRHANNEVVEKYGVRVTSVERTVHDLVRILDPRDGLAILDSALRLGLDLTMLNTSRPSAAKLRQMLPLASDRSDSPLESRSRFLTHELGFPMPQEQVSVFDQTGNFVARLDFWWPELGLIGEADGAVKYSTLLRPGETVEDVIRNERQREKNLQNLGNHVIRWNWSDTMRSGKFGRILEAGMRTAANMPPPHGDYRQLPMAPLMPVDHSKQFEAVRFRPAVI